MLQRKLASVVEHVVIVDYILCYSLGNSMCTRQTLAQHNRKLYVNKPENCNE